MCNISLQFYINHATVKILYYFSNARGYLHRLSTNAMVLSHNWVQFRFKISLLLHRRVNLLKNILLGCNCGLKIDIISQCHWGEKYCIGFDDILKDHMTILCL